ncbi:MAG: CoA transferase, partial [Candidatus Aenigmarchaeota archaeon]|nr:CoA transferase [Candidatus Aenigmarchaeota archaeon]
MKSQDELNCYIRDQRSEENLAGLPLRDIRVIDLATVLAAPFAATLMGDFGAEVIKVENPEVPEAIRGWGVLEGGIQPFWAVFGRNKFPVTINLKSPDGKGILLKLIERSDVLIENMRPGTMEKLGFDMEKLLEL